MAVQEFTPREGYRTLVVDIGMTANCTWQSSIPINLDVTICSDVICFRQPQQQGFCGGARLR